MRAEVRGGEGVLARDAVRAVPSPAFEKIMAFYEKAGTHENGWVFTTQTGVYGTDYLNRALLTAAEAERLVVPKM